jgi:hypothetical protein
MTRAMRAGNWSVQEFERLRQLLPRRGVAVTATLLRRSEESVRRKAFLLLRVPPRRGDWTASDDAVLRESWGAVELRLLAAMTGRAPADVRRRADVLRARVRTGPWTRAEQLSLKDLHGTRTNADLEVCLSRPVVEITAMAAHLCLAKDKRFAAGCSAPSDGLPARPAGAAMPRWTAADVERLREIYCDRDNLTVARELRRTVVSVANKANQLGLKKSHELLADLGRSNIARRYERAAGQVAENGAG